MAACVRITQAVLFFMGIIMPKVLIIQASLNPQSKTAVVVREAEKILTVGDAIKFIEGKSN